jgi:hypothetical protein
MSSSLVVESTIEHKRKAAENWANADFELDCWIFQAALLR